MSFLETRIPPVIVALFSALLIWVLAKDYPGMRIDIPYNWIITLVFFLDALMVSFAGVFAFRKAQTTTDPIHPDRASSLVTGGVYRFSRNPMYLGMLLMLVGVAFYFPSYLAICGPLFYIIYMTRFQIIPEERAMSELFGEEYEAYRSRVGRWLLVV